MNNYSSKNIVIWGLGTHGGGLACALYFLKQGLPIYILDDKPLDLLKESLEFLKPYQASYEISVTRKEVLEKADLVIKNPAISRSHPFLQLCKNIETDISLFLAKNSNPLIAITGTKGKSSLASYLTQLLKQEDPFCLLGGNITRSPLSFINELNGKSPVVLELSSWQLADLPEKVFKPYIAILTNLYHDHQNTYSHFDLYVKDKLRLIENQSEKDFFFCEEEAYFSHFLRLKTDCKARRVVFPSFRNFLIGKENSSYSIYAKQGKVFWRARSTQKPVKFFDLPQGDLPIVSYCKMLAGSIALKYGMEHGIIRKALSLPLRVEHRLEFVVFQRGVAYYNDSAATMPEATLASALSLLTRYTSLLLIVGGTDKELDFTCFELLIEKKISWILLEGSATCKIQRLLKEKGLVFYVEETLEACVSRASQIACQGEAVLFSPASASFEKFKDEFDRGIQFKSILKSL